MAQESERISTGSSDEMRTPSERESRAVHCAAPPPQTDLYTSGSRKQNGETTWQILTIKTRLKWTQQIWRMLKRWRKRKLGKTTVKRVS
ncbi:hypothetical protein Q8A67_013080 [Cirrhinus molitorella]|uniref:Uncharacterized protein n=1 Tax=Cirrhinus molitorella TaxID=172907 RepID=A0AA88PZI5_9TELE|nr:hypothetical protein Q8A67_013080 [Cirrhinus molitorella]